jgi:hypothetical protein
MGASIAAACLLLVLIAPHTVPPRAIERRGRVEFKK